MRKTTLAILIVFISILGYSQDENGIIRCTTDEIHEQKMNDPEYAAAFQQKVQSVKNYINNNSVDGKLPPCNNPILIPVAVHFQNITIDQACAEQMALDQVDRMNLDYSGTNTDITEWANAQASGSFNGISNGESCIQFCLATLEHPAGFGLNDGDYAITINQTTGDNDAAWSGYLNFWIRDEGGGVLGYSPLGGNLNGDGVFCDFAVFSSVSCGGNVINPTYNLGRTMTHEVGHYLLLDHPFFGYDCSIDGDGVADTPRTDVETFGCPAFGDVSCTDPILWMDFMDYTNDACMYMFSQGQVDRMETYVNTNLASAIAAGVTKCQESACIDFSGDASFQNETCDGFDGLINAQVMNANEPVGYSINGGVTFQTDHLFDNVTQGTYNLVILDDAGCEYTEEIVIERDPAELNLVSKENSFCGDSSGSIVVNVDESSTFNYSIDGAAFQPDPVFENLNYGEYTITAINNVGCAGSMVIKLDDDNNMDVIVDERKNINCFYFDNGAIEFHVLGAIGPMSYTLDSGAETSNIPNFDELGEGLHSIHIVDSIGCQEDLNFEIIRSFSSIDEDCPCKVYVPNAMTPDEDGVNDLLRIQPSCPITNFNIEIYDRWGRVIFQSNDIEHAWNAGDKVGNYYAVDGLYFYRIKYSWGNEFESTTEEVITGNILVLR